MELSRLGWNSFQQLCHTITGRILGQTVESFLDTNDAGRDGAFTGNWKNNGYEDLSGEFVIQCKFTSKENYNIRKSDLSDEVEKARKLVLKGKCDVYILMTNAGITGRMALKIEQLFKEAGVKTFKVFGENWIERQIIENRHLRMLVPRVYGLGDLSQILDERAYRQTRAVLESLREDLSKVVVTEAYSNAVKALEQHGFVLLIGEPAAGKTTIAQMLAMAAIDNWNCSILNPSSPEETIKHWNPDEPTQFFLIDDAFGISQYEADLATGWNHIFPKMKAMIHHGAKIVLTSRDYIYRRAKEKLKESVFPLILESQVVIDVQDLTLKEKRQILYNHIKLGDQPVSFRREIKPFLEYIASHKRFIPEIARRLSNPFFTQNLRLTQYDIDRFIDGREDFLKDIILKLDVDSKAALGLIFIRNNHLTSPVYLDKGEKEVIDRLGSNISGCLTALESLKGSLVHFSIIDNKPFWSFKHPTIGDAYAAILSASPELISIYLMGIELGKMLRQVTCGNVGIENTIIIPDALFPEVIRKLQSAINDKNQINNSRTYWQTKTMVIIFLSYRCSKEFLEAYIETNADILEMVSKPDLYLSSTPELNLAVRLFEIGLLPEKNRKTFVDTVSESAIEGLDLYALDNPRIKNMFSETEFTNLLLGVKNNLLHCLDNVRLYHENNFQPDENAEDAIQPFIDSLLILKNYFGDQKNIARLIEEQFQKVDDWISENAKPEPEIEMDNFEYFEPDNYEQSERSIFDDIDE